MNVKQPKINYEIVSVQDTMKDPNAAYLLVKRGIDITGALVGIVLLVIITASFMFFYFYGTNKGPIFYKQQRLGRNGQIFNIYKFRSMVMNAEDILKKDELLYKKYNENNFKIAAEEDPRITAFGLFIRKTSLDELPQFINVLKGEMSLVGPRPLVEQEIDVYENQKEQFLSVKPGITGFWQISGRSNVSYPERAGIELYYIQNQSIRMDIEILFKTVVQVVKRTGAY